MKDCKRSGLKKTHINKGNPPLILLRKPLVLFTASRYARYGLQAIRVFLLAKYLDPFYFGIWGFITLTLRYLDFTGLGIKYAVTVELATGGFQNQRDTARDQLLIENALSITLLIAVLLLLAGSLLAYLDVGLYKAEVINKNLFLIVLIAFMEQFQQLFANIYRVYRRLLRIALSEMIISIIPVLTIISYHGPNLIQVFMLSLLVAALLSNLVYLVQAPFRLRIRLDRQQSMELLKLSLPLLIFNVSFYLISMLSHTIVGIFYPLEVMGYFSFANSISRIVLLGVDTFAWVIFPILLAKVKKGVDDEEAQRVADSIGRMYATFVYLIVFLAILGAPIIFLILPQYDQARSVLYILLMGQVLRSLSFGYGSIGIARRKQYQMALINILTIVIVVPLALFLAVHQFHFALIAVAHLIGSFFNALVQMGYGARLVGVRGAGLVRVVGGPIAQYLLIVGIVLMGIVSGQTLLSGVVALTLFLAMSAGNLRSTWAFVYGDIKGERAASL